MKTGGKTTLGILGGMGPLSSAEFLRTVYESSPRTCAREQDAPVVILLSDPSFPDRTDAFLKGDDQEILGKLVSSLNRLGELGASKLVICCMTIHYLLPRLPSELRRRVVSLLDVIFDNLGRRREQHLVACSIGTRELALFQNHEQWQSAKDLIVFPGASDQRRLHELIYRIKENRDLDEAASFLEALLSKYEARSFIVGCSEIHILAKHLFARGNKTRYGCVDPFAIIAKELTEDNL